MTQLGGRDEAVVVTVEDLYINHSQVLAQPRRGIDRTLKASRISSSESVSFILRAIMVRNSGVACQYVAQGCGRWEANPEVLFRNVPGKSMVPLLSASTSLIISCSSDSDGFWPSERMTVPSSLVVICPEEPT